MTEAQTTAAIYCRISDDRAGAGLGVKRQEDDCRAYCERRGWNVGEVLTDNDISAYSGKRRPAYERLLEEVKNGTFNAIVCWHPDRLHRSPSELETFIELVEATGVAVGTVQAGEYDLATATGRMSARIVGAVARHESEHKSERIRRKARELAENGKLGGGGTRPFGFDNDRITVRDSEAALVREAAGRVLAGEPIRAVCRDWTQRGISTVIGGNWNPYVMLRMLMSPRIAGLREHRGAVVGKAEWEPIITEADHKRLVTILSDPSRRKNTGHAGRRYLLSGLLVCHHCGARMVARPNNDKKRRYVCAKGPGFHGCNRTMIMAEPLEEMVTEMALEALDSPAMDRALNATEPDDSEALAAVEAAEAKLEELAEQWARDELSRSEWQAGRRVVEQRLADARERLTVDQTPRALQGATGGRLRQEWPDLSFDRRQAILAALFESIIIGAGRRGYNRFEPGRVHPVWRY
jgi:DNA invertase Pin-like site-specific DNA recombinase